MKKTFTAREIAVCAMIAAVYTALCIALAPISYGPVQVRVAEALTLTAVFSPICVWGVAVGCALSNIIGFMLGVNILGFLDILFGTAATLIAAIFSYQLRNIRVRGLPVLSALPPVIVNALVIGLELTYMIEGTFLGKTFALNAAYVGAGQFVACFMLGLPLVYLLEKAGIPQKYFGAGK